ncbi:Clavaminate synthase-like protein [Mycena galopus ATCC 62051]|nr:Clavaminate synthase-like protein [Mycena galopus ATCC 62051]
MTSAEIPIIDLSSCLQQEEIVLQIRRACETVGLFYVTNHGIPEEVIERCFNASKEFFSLDDEAKMLLWQEDPVAINVGYRPSLDSKVDPRGTHDPVEGFVVKWEEPGDEEFRNKWPAVLPGMSDAVLDCYTHGLKLGKLLYQLIALAMGMQEDYFNDKTKDNITRLRLLHYPSQTSEVLGSGKHSDFGTFTLLFQQSGMEALQVAAPQTGWIFIPPIPRTILVNLGDQTTICTNGAFRSPLHRVVSRPGPERYSIPLFFLADLGVVLEPDASFVTAERPHQYPPMTAADQFAKRVSESWAKD